MTDVLEVSRPATGVLALTINRPDSLNAVSVAVQRELDHQLSAAEGDPNIRAVVLAGAGDKALSAGYDIHELAAMSHDEHTLVQLQREEWLWHWANTPLPTVVACRGIVYGVGAILATCADLRVGGPSTTFKITATAYGGANLTWVLDALIGWSHAKDLLLTSRKVSAHEARDMGLLNRNVNDDEVFSTSVALAADIAALPPDGVREAKRLIQTGMGRDLRSRFDAENTAMMTTIRPGEMTDVFAGFLGAREPRAAGVDSADANAG